MQLALSPKTQRIKKSSGGLIEKAWSERHYFSNHLRSSFKFGMAAASNEAVSTQGEGYHHISLMILFTVVVIQTSITVPLKNFGPLGCTYSTDHCMVKHIFVGTLLWGTLFIRAYFMRSRIGKFSEQFSNQRNSARRTNITQMGAKTRKRPKTQIQHIAENSSRKTWFSSR